VFFFLWSSMNIGVFIFMCPIRPISVHKVTYTRLEQLREKTVMEHIKITTITTPHRYSWGYTKQHKNTDAARKDWVWCSQNVFQCVRRRCNNIGIFVTQELMQCGDFEKWSVAWGWPNKAETSSSLIIILILF
jgi:hypothetical protein